jgi:hypothetical protein
MGSWHTYALMLESVDMAFFDARSTTDLTADEIVARPVLFRVAVHKSAYNTGRWPKVGSLSVPKALATSVPRFRQDPINGQLETSDDGGVTFRAATLDECCSLERLAVWEPEHVEDRLGDHYAGVPNKWVESLRPRRGHA